MNLKKGNLLKPQNTHTNKQLKRPIFESIKIAMSIAKINFNKNKCHKIPKN